MTEPTITAPRAAETDEIEAVYRRRHREFIRVAASITGDAESARDAVQEGLARAFAARASLRRRGSVEAWLWKVVVNAARNAARRRRDHGEPAAAEALERERDPERELVRAAVAGLPERQRLVLFLRYYADLDYAAIARVLGVRRGTVSATLNHAHAALRRSLAQEVHA
jgi:RNA polymerase sigma factor (sigma-70 family)